MKMDIYQKVHAQALLCDCNTGWHKTLTEWGFKSAKCILNSADTFVYILEHYDLDKTLEIKEGEYLVKKANLEYLVVSEQTFNEEYIIEDKDKICPRCQRYLIYCDCPNQ